MHCDECGRDINKIFRTYHNHKYCGTCYAREFKQRYCPGCGKLARLLRSNPDMLCRQCERNRPCVRCGKDHYRLGKMTIYGPVCNVCRPYFQVPKPCTQCGKLSTRLSRVHRLGLETPVCPRCATQDHGTCNACHRYRLLIQTAEGKNLCKACHTLGKRQCPECGQSMPAGLKKQCHPCYWKGLWEKRRQINRAAFSVLEMAEHFDEFCDWLSHRLGYRKAAITMNRYTPFFMEIEQEWKIIPSYPDLIQHFGTAQLRKVLLPIQWITEKGHAVVDEKLKQEWSENHRISQLLIRFTKESVEHKVLNHYYQHLEKKLVAGKTTVRSMRLALSPAVTLLQKSTELNQPVPDQMVLDHYLKATPGQRAALSGFIRHLNRHQGTELELPSANSQLIKQAQKRKLESELKSILNNPERDKKARQRWLAATLAYFHKLPQAVAKAIPDINIEFIRDEEIKVTWDEQEYWLPNDKNNPFTYS